MTVRRSPRAESFDERDRASNSATDCGSLSSNSSASPRFIATDTNRASAP